MFNTLNKIRKQATIALHAKENRILEEGLLYNLSCDAFYNSFPACEAIKEVIRDGNLDFKLLYSPNGKPVASIVVRENGIHVGSLLYNYHTKAFSVIDPSTSSGQKCDIRSLYAKIMRLAEIDDHRRGTGIFATAA